MISVGLPLVPEPEEPTVILGPAPAVLLLIVPHT
jgi:hypothetical protein